MGGYTIARNGKKKENDWNDGQDISDFAYDSVSDTYDSIYRIFRALKMQNSLLAVIIVLTGTSVAYATFFYMWDL